MAAITHITDFIWSTITIADKIGISEYQYQLDMDKIFDIDQYQEYMDYLYPVLPFYQQLYIDLKDQILERAGLITRQGLRVDEIQYSMIAFTIFRFIFYSFKYNVVTSFKLCGISSISCILWVMHFNDVLYRYHNLLDYHPLLTRAVREDLQARNETVMARVREDWMNQINQMENPDDMYSFKFLTPIRQNLPDNIKSKVEPIILFIQLNLKGYLRLIYKTYIRKQMPFVTYIIVVRIGKKYCPYHVRWHFSYIYLLNMLESPLGRTAERARKHEFYLLARSRYEEAETLRLYLGALPLVHLSFTLLGLLHAVFGQYFYIPLLTQTVELQVGKRPTNSFYSGGYTSWQDDFEFNNIQWGQLMRLWWGWLGRGTKEQIEKRRRDNKKRRRRKKK